MDEEIFERFPFRIMLNHIYMHFSAPSHAFFMALFLVDAHSGDSVNLTRVSRRQMGAYLCIASNDVPPAVSKRVFLNVHCKYCDFRAAFSSELIKTNG